MSEPWPIADDILRGTPMSLYPTATGPVLVDEEFAADTARPTRMSTIDEALRSLGMEASFTFVRPPNLRLSAAHLLPTVPLDMRPGPGSKAQALASLDALVALSVDAEVVAAMVGASLRRFQEWHKEGEEMPWQRIEAAARAVAALGMLLASDRDATLGLFRGARAMEAAGLVATGRYGSLAALVAEARAEAARELAAITPPFARPVALPADVDPRRVAAMIESPEFAALQELFEALMLPPLPLSELVWRGQALLAFDAAAEAIARGEDTDDRWTFIAFLSSGALGALRSRVVSFLRDLATEPDAWEPFLKGEASATYAATESSELEPLDESDDYDYEGPPALLPPFKDFGIDLRTGLVRDA